MVKGLLSLSIPGTCPIFPSYFPEYPRLLCSAGPLATIFLPNILLLLAWLAACSAVCSSLNTTNP